MARPASTKHFKIVRLLADGWSVREIANTLHMSTQAIYQHRTRALDAGELLPDLRQTKGLET